MAVHFNMTISGMFQIKKLDVFQSWKASSKIKTVYLLEASSVKTGNSCNVTFLWSWIRCIKSFHFNHWLRLTQAAYENAPSHLKTDSNLKRNNSKTTLSSNQNLRDIFQMPCFEIGNFITLGSFLIHDITHSKNSSMIIKNCINVYFKFQFKK